MRESLTAQLKPLLGILGTSMGVIITFSTVVAIVQLVAAITSVVLACVTIRYYWVKTNKLKDS